MGEGICRITHVRITKLEVRRIVDVLVLIAQGIGERWVCWGVLLRKTPKCKAIHGLVGIVIQNNAKENNVIPGGQMRADGETGLREMD